jgi:SAM-dependent methyltransferase
MMSEAPAGTQYDRWLRSGSVSGRGYAFLASVPGMLLVNTPAYRFDKNLGIKPEQRYLDIGCGRGSLLRVLGNRVRFGTRPVGVDASAEMLALAVGDGTAESADLVHGDGTSLPFPDTHFDLVTSGYLLKHLDGPAFDRFMAEILRVLSPGGLALLWEFAPTRSRRVNALNRWVVTRGVESANFRPYSEVAAAATRAGFDWVEKANLRPFFFPPIPRMSVIVGKAPEGWRQQTGPGRARRLALTNT